METNFNFYIHLINIIGLYEHDFEDDEDQGKEWWKRWCIIRYNEPAVKWLKSHHTYYTLKRLTARTNFTNRGVHEGPNRKFLELRDQIENNK